MVERYIKEYANACKKEMKQNGLIQEDIKHRAERIIDDALKFKDNGLITADEAVKMILERFND